MKPRTYSVGLRRVMFVTPDRVHIGVSRAWAEKVADALAEQTTGGLSTQDRERILEELCSGALALIRVGDPVRALDDPWTHEVENLRDLVEPETQVFRMRLVDEIGEPLPDVAISVDVAGSASIHTSDAEGFVVIEHAGRTSSARAHVDDIDRIRSILQDRWSTVREAPWLASGPGLQFMHLPPPGTSPSTYAIEAGVTKTLVVRPHVTSIVLEGAVFHRQKSCLRLERFAAVLQSKLREIGTSDVLVVAHADVSADLAYNEKLAQERAEMAAAYLRHDVDAWLDAFATSVRKERRWTTSEDQVMLDALTDGGPQTPLIDRVRAFQQRAGLPIDGRVGPQTRQALIRAAMDLVHEVAKDVASISAHAIAATSEIDVSNENRSLEIFVFRDGMGILPPPPEEVSDPEGAVYLEWRRRSASPDRLEKAEQRTRLQSIILSDSLVLEEVAAGIEVLAPDSHAPGAVYRVQCGLLMLASQDARPTPADFIDGVYGTTTEALVTEFQRRTGLPESGIVDAVTLRALDENLLTTFSES